MPSWPEPANRSSTRAPAKRNWTALNMPSLTRSTVGRVISSPGSAASLVPRAVPEITRISFSLYARAALPPRRTSFLSAFCGRCAGKCGTSLDFFTHYRRLQAFCQLPAGYRIALFQRAAPCFFTSRRKAAPAAGENGHTRPAPPPCLRLWPRQAVPRWPP